MPRPISNEIRKTIIIHKENKIKEEEIANFLIISKSTVTKVWALYKQTGTYQPKPRKQGRKPAVTEQIMAEIEEQIKKTPDITLSELIDKFNLTITISALCRRLKKLNYSFKKRQLIQPIKIAKMSKKNVQNFKNT